MDRPYFTASLTPISVPTPGVKKQYVCSDFVSTLNHPSLVTAGEYFTVAMYMEIFVLINNSKEWSIIVDIITYDNSYLKMVGEGGGRKMLIITFYDLK